MVISLDAIAIKTLVDSPKYFDNKSINIVSRTPAPPGAPGVRVPTSQEIE